MKLRSFARSLFLACAILATGSLPAQVIGCNYAQKLIEQLSRTNPTLASVTVHAAAPGDSVSRIIATTGAGLSGESKEADLLALRTESARVLPVGEAGTQGVSLPLRDVSNKTVGVIEFEFYQSSPKSDGDLIEEAITLRNGLRMFIPTHDRLLEKFRKGYVPSETLGQRLVMQAAGADTGLWVVALHAVPPAEQTNVVIAANAPEQMGHPSDEVDTDTAISGRTVIQLFPLTHRMEVHMPLRIGNGNPVATLTTVCLLRDESQVAGFVARSMAARDEMEPRVPNFEALFKP